MKILAAAFASALLAVGFTAAAAQQQKDKPADTTAAHNAAADQRYRYRLLGVFDDESGAPIQGAEVRDLVSGLSSPTSLTGTVSLFFLPDSGSLIHIRKIGYDPQTLTVAITPKDTAPVTVVLHRSAQELPTVKVTGAATPTYMSPLLRGAQQRMDEHAGGYYIDENQMRKLDSQTLALALTPRMPGLRSTQGAHGETYLVSSRQACANTMGGCRSANCFISVYVDGIKSTQVPQDFNRLSPQDYAIAEFYSSAETTPAEFGPSPCGTLLLWTRER